MPAEKFFHDGEPNLKVEWGCKHPEHRGRNCDGVLIEGGHVFVPDDVADLDRLIGALRRARRHMEGAHRAPCVDGSVCGEPAHCPPPEEPVSPPE